MIMIDKIKEYIKCPQFGDLEYGEWGALRLEQREAYKHLIEIIEWQEHEISRLNGLIKEIKDYSGKEILEEPKGIPEKLDDILGIDDLEPPYDENLDKIWRQTIKNQNKINEILDYLESKGE